MIPKVHPIPTTKWFPRYKAGAKATFDRYNSFDRCIDILVRQIYTLRPKLSFPNIAERSCILFIMLLWTGYSYAQNCNDFTASATGDTLLCDSIVPVPLSASFSIAPVSITWSPSTGLSSTTLPSVTASANTTTTYTVTAQAVIENLIFNGDFELGDAGFSTDYDMASGGPNGPLHNEGEYQISNNPNATHQDFAACGDQTSGMGNMMVVNSSAQQDEVWCQVVSVEPNTDYAFSAWVTAVSPLNPAILQFSFDGTLLGNPIEASPNPCEWSQFVQSWNSGDASSVEICITNVNDAATGNDFALDDISFGPLCEATDSVTVTLGERPETVQTVICEGSPNSITLSWVPSFGAGSYLIDVLNAPSGMFTGETSYTIEDLQSEEQVYYELLAVSPEGCLSHVYSGGCFTTACPDYELQIEGETIVCLDNLLELTFSIITESEGPFILVYDIEGVTDTLTGLQAGENIRSIAIPQSGEFSVLDLTDLSFPNCDFTAILPSFPVTVELPAEAGIGVTAVLCTPSDTTLQLSDFIEGEDVGGQWSASAPAPLSDAFNSATSALDLSLVNEAGIYQFEYRVGTSSCGFDTATVVLDLLAAPVANAGGILALDCNNTTVSLGGTPEEGVIYNWNSSNAPPIVEPGTPNPIVSNPGTYILRVEDPSNGCTTVDTAVVLDERTTPVPLLSVFKNDCDNELEAEISVDSVSNGNAPFTYSLNGGVFTSNPLFSGLSAGNYTIEVMDAGGCSGMDTVVLAPNANVSLNLTTADGIADPVVTFGDAVTLRLNSNLLPGGFDVIAWEPEVCVACIEITVFPNETTLYEVSAVRPDGCIYTATLEVKVEDRQRLFLPTAFSPNSDGRNDQFFVYAGAEFVRGLQLQVFNRWGGLVYENTDFPLNDSAAGWDGRIRGERAPTGVYAFQLVAERIDGSTLTLSGEVNLLY